MKKALIKLAPLFLLVSKNVPAFLGYDLLGEEKCLGADKISHQPGKHWEVMDPHWGISKENIDSPLAQFSANTTLFRTVEPYHIGFALADITCHYQSDTLVLTRTYEEGMNAFPKANLIIADANIHKIHGWFLWNTATSCHTTLDSLDECSWKIYYIYDNSSSSFELPYTAKKPNGMPTGSKLHLLISTDLLH